MTFQGARPTRAGDAGLGRLAGACLALAVGVIVFWATLSGGDSDIYAPRAGGLGLIAIAIAAIAVRLGPGAAGSLVLLHAVMLALYHGLPELGYALFPEASVFYRGPGGVADADAAAATVVAGGGLVAFALAAIVVHARVRPRVVRSNLAALDLVSARFLFGWTLAGFLYRGGGREMLPPSVHYWGDAVFQYAMPAAFALLLLKVLRSRRASGRAIARVLPFLALLTVTYVMLAATRFEVGASVLAAALLAHKWGVIRVTSLRAAGVTVALLVVFVGLAAVRAEVGREALIGVTLEERADALLSATANLSGGLTPRAVEAVGFDAGYRLDGNAFLASTMVRSGGDIEPDGGAFGIAAALVVPSSLWAAKLDQDVTARDPEAYLVARHGLRDIDYLVTPLAVLYASGGVAAVLLGMAGLGAALASLDRRLASPGGSLLALSAAVCLALAMAGVERDVKEWALQARNAVVVAAILFMASVVARRRKFRV